MYKLFMALRYLRAHKIIYFSIAGVAIGIAVMIIVTSVMGGFSRNIRERIRGMHSHVVIQTPYIAGYEEIADRIAKLPRITGCAPRLEYMGWLGAGSKKYAVVMVGIDPDREKHASGIDRFFKKGSVTEFRGSIFGPPPEDPAGPYDIIAGMQVSDWIGQELNISTAIELDYPQLRTARFKVKGWFKSGMNEYDGTYVFLSLPAMQKFLQARTDGRPYCNQLAVGVEDYDRDKIAAVESVLAELHKIRPCSHPDSHVALGRCGPFFVRTWEQEKQNLLAAVEIEKGVQVIILFFIVIVAGFNIMAIYTLMVRAKTRDVGVLRALGGTARGVTSIFLLSGAACGLAGSVVGIGAGLLIATNLNEILDFIRISSRELNTLAFNRPEGSRLFAESRTLTILADVLASLALAGLIVSWTRLYRSLRKADVGLAILSGLLLASAAWVFFSWMPGFSPSRDYDWASIPGSARGWIAGLLGVLPPAWALVRRLTEPVGDRFAGGVVRGIGTLLYAALALAGGAMVGVASSLSILRPPVTFSGYDLFPRDIYYLDRVPVLVDTRAIVMIVLATLVVSTIFSIYPALRASRTDPIEAIRDE